MPNQVAILRVQTNPDPNPSFTVGGVFWLTVPANNVNPAPFAQSQVPWIDATTLSALRAGTLVEQSFASQPFFCPLRCQEQRPSRTGVMRLRSPLRRLLPRAPR